MLTFFEVTLLRLLKTTKDEKELSKMTNVDGKTIAATLDELFDRDYIGEDSMVTEKGFELVNQPSIQVSDPPKVELSALETLLLKSVNRSMNDKALSKLAKVDLATISAKLDKLFDEDLISENLLLTKKGFNLLYRETERPSDRATRSSVQDLPKRDQTANAPNNVVIIQREIVKVPCRYCGNLNEIATSTVCSRCGATLK